MDIRIAAYGVIIEDGRMLLAHWNEHGRSGWTVPGGGVEGIEHPTETVVREIFEETGYHAQVEELLGVDTMIVPAEARHTADAPLYALRVIYKAAILSGDLRHETDGSSDEARWVPIDEITDLKRVSLLDIAVKLYQTRPAIGRV